MRFKKQTKIINSPKKLFQQNQNYSKAPQEKSLNVAFAIAK